MTGCTGNTYPAFVVQLWEVHILQDVLREELECEEKMDTSRVENSELGGHKTGEMH